MQSPRAIATRNGDQIYFTGKPCKNGHVSERYTRNGECTACAADRSAARDKDYFRTWYAINSDRWRKHVADYRSANKEKVKDCFRRWYSENREKVIEASQEWARQNSEEAKRIARVTQHRRRKAIKCSVEHHTATDVRNIIELQNGKCPYCSTSLKSAYHIDHITPLAKGGHNGKSNIQVLCPTCNRRKGRKDPIVWANENGMLL